VTKLKARVAGRDLHVLVEPAASIVGPAGVLLTKVLYRKTTGGKEFVIVDAAIERLIRPALYRRITKSCRCARAREAPFAPMWWVRCARPAIFWLAIASFRKCFGRRVGRVYRGRLRFAQASTYNARRRPAEVMVDGKTWNVIRERESYEDLIRGEV